QHPGTTLDQASNVFAIPVAQLRRDLEQLFLAGLPPYGPGDLIDVDIDEDGAIWIAMADHFARPLRLTRQEALAVYVRATELAAVWDVDVDDERLLRIDRIASVDATGERFSPHGLQGAGRPLYTPSRRDVDVKVRLHPAARWVAEYYLARDVREGPDGSLEVTLPTATTQWLARLFLRLGRDADVLEPAGLRDEIVAQARETLARYG